MILFIQCLILCILFTILILPAQYRNPLSQFASYPIAIKKRVYELPQYKDFITSVEHKNWKRKILGTLLIAVLLAVLVYFSGKGTFETAFFHVFVLFIVVNLYDLIVFDLIIFCHSKKLMIPGTEDMKEEYRNPMHHIIGALKGCAIGTLVAFISASLVFIIGLFR
ncbi:hypothetical protein [Lacrimispora sp. 38-1]|uniref:hypothetical protein n=1 Tax=Lacrimispora sp. 38-1 TaxID=3125778 RepID=UPI003CEB9B35